MQDINATLDDIASLYHNYINVYNPFVDFQYVENEFTMTSGFLSEPKPPTVSVYFDDVVKFLKNHQHEYDGWRRFTFLDIKNSFHIKFTICQGKLQDNLVFCFLQKVDHTF